MRRPRRPAHDLRVAIDLMPEETRDAMLRGIEVNPIIVGAYTDREGGVCPMLAAHRNGGRTSFASFARAWDRYTRAGASPRRASEREVRVLRTMLEASLATEHLRGGRSLRRAIAEHRDSLARRAVLEEHALADPRPDTGEHDLTEELSQRRGWAWLRPFRRLDEYERAVEELAYVEASSERDKEPVA